MQLGRSLIVSINREFCDSRWHPSSNPRWICTKRSRISDEYFGQPVHSRRSTRSSKVAKLISSVILLRLLQRRYSLDTSGCKAASLATPFDMSAEHTVDKSRSAGTTCILRPNLFFKQKLFIHLSRAVIFALFVLSYFFIHASITVFAKYVDLQLSVVESYVSVLRKVEKKYFYL